MIFGPKLQLLDCNDAAATMFGFRTRDEILRKAGFGSFPSLADRNAITECVQPVSSPKRVIVSLHRDDGSDIQAVGTIVGDRDLAGEQVQTYCHLEVFKERRQTERKVRRLNTQLLEAHNEERRKLSHDLHDSTGQTLSALGMNLELIKTAWPEMPAKAASYLADCEALLQECVRDVRTISYSLHPPLLDELGLVAAMQWYVEGFSSRSAISVTVEVQPDVGRLSPILETTLFRIMQESLVNVYRHSGSKTAQIQLWREPRFVVLKISDQGRGFVGNAPLDGSAGEGIGLASIRQQLAQVHGRLEIATGLHGTLLAYVPCSSSDS